MTLRPSFSPAVNFHPRIASIVGASKTGSLDCLATTLTTFPLVITTLDDTSFPLSVIVTPSSSTQFKEYQFTVDNLPEFTGFTIKIVMSGTNQAQPPRIKDLRAIAVR